MTESSPIVDHLLPQLLAGTGEFVSLNARDGIMKFMKDVTHPQA